MMQFRPQVAFFLLSLAAVSNAQTDPVVIKKIVDEGTGRNQVMRHLRGLTNIGPRLTSSPNLAKAQQFAMAKFKSFGLTNVHLEKWGEVPVGFQRGRRQVARMVAPERRDLVFTTMNWAAGTPGRVRAEAIKAPATAAEVTANPDAVKGKWALMPIPTTMRGPVANDLKTALHAAGVAGLVYGAADERVHSSGRFTDKSFEKQPKEVEVILRKSDFDAVNLNVASGKTELEFNIENTWIKGPVEQFNVIADIVGTEKPDEMVIVCGHLDSWNSPGSQGACDNGTGTVAAIEAARLLMASGAKPKRTIRFILWSGEEQGLLGSRGYVEKHKSELSKISAVLNDDGGTNYQGGYQGLETMRPIMEAAFQPTLAAFPDLPMKFVSIERMPQGGSSDHAPFIWAGVPAFFTMETGRADYGYVWHTQNDRYENAIPEYLFQSSTNHALVAYGIANAPDLLPRFPIAPRATPLALHHEEAVGADRMYADPSKEGLCDHDDDYVQFVEFKLRWMYRRLLAGARR